MVDVAEVKIWGDRVGAVLWDESKRLAAFEYDPAFLKKGLDLAPIKMPLPEAQSGRRIYSFPELNYETFLGLPGLLSDSLPDRFGTALLDRWLAEQGRSIESVNPVERLCYTGARGMGALEYHPPKREIVDKGKLIEIERLVKLANDVLAEREDFRADLEHLDKQDILEIIKVGTSAGGARAKAVVAYNRQTGEIRSGQIDNLDGYEYWIIKLDGVTNRRLGDPRGYGRIEYAYYLMARDCGIDMTACELKHEGDRAHFMTKRFDRQQNEKVHLLSLCGIAHYDYNRPHAYSYEQAFQVIRTLGLHYPAAEELFRRMCFNVVARNQDDHTKNISFLMDKNGSWRLSPAYDVAYAYNPEAGWTSSHQMTINGKYDQIDRTDLVEVARRMNVNKPDIIIDRIVEVVGNWPDYAARTGVDELRTKVIGKTHVLL
ncbi:MAG TPA: type II toxin-antitoxin system HipA family toxin [candidate division Zixibacteria bacterium]|nr:type II toxin-antitoxin system HipA family toxin [candidate division Zixibacteria bacterium]